MSAVAAIVLLATTGSALLIAGAYVLAGNGIAMLVGGSLFIVAAVILRSGLMPNG